MVCRKWLARSLPCHIYLTYSLFARSLRIFFFLFIPVFAAFLGGWCALSSLSAALCRHLLKSPLVLEVWFNEVELDSGKFVDSNDLSFRPPFHPRVLIVLVPSSVAGNFACVYVPPLPVGHRSIPRLLEVMPPHAPVCPEDLNQDVFCVVGRQDVS